MEAFADILFMACVAAAMIIGIHMIAKPDYHAARGKGAFARPRTVRTLGIVCVVGASAALLLRSLT